MLGRLAPEYADSQHHRVPKAHSAASLVSGGDLGGLKPSGGHFNAGRKELREAGYVAELALAAL
jgi:hypothetical protein